MKVGLFGAALYLAYSQGWLSFLGLGTAAAPATGTPATAGSTPLAVGVPTPIPVSTSPAPVNASSTLDALYTKMVTAAKAAGTTSTGVDGWGYYLNNSGITAPDPIPAFSAAIPNFDRSQNFTAPAYWAIMAPALRSQLGLSGLGVYGGLGALMRRYA